ICPATAELAADDETKGRFSPTTIIASSLSAVSRVGAESTFECVSACRALINAASHGTVTVLELLDELLELEEVDTVHLLPDAIPRLRPVTERGLVSALDRVPKFSDPTPSALPPPAAV